MGELMAEFRTGSDDLRGGNDNVHLILLLTNDAQLRFENVNDLNSWTNNSVHRVSRSLPANIRFEDIVGVRLETTFGGGIGGDNWNLEHFTLRVEIGDETRTLIDEGENPLFRFTGEQRVLEFDLLPTPTPHNGPECPQDLSGHVLGRGIGTPIEEWWNGETMTLASGRTVNDYYPAFMAALESYDTAIPNDRSWERRRGFTLLFGPCDYYFSNTPTLIRGMHLLGQGGHGGGFGTVFRYADNIHGLIIRFRDMPTTEPTISGGGGRGRADGSVIENITFVGNGPRSRENHGIWALAQVRISNCIITNWGGNGIRMTSEAVVTDHFTPGKPPTLQLTAATDLSLVEHCLIQQCGWRDVAFTRKASWEGRLGDMYYDGIYIEGGDSNGSLFNAVHCTSNGRWGFYDQSTSGCTFVACMTHNNGIVKDEGVADNVNDSGSFKVARPSARSVFIGCYAEQGQRPAELSQPSLVFGGVMAVDPSRGQYFYNDADGILHLENGVSVHNRVAERDRATGRETIVATLGSAKEDSVAFEAVNEGNPYPLMLKYNETPKTWAWRQAAGNIMLIGADKDIPETDVSSAENSEEMRVLGHREVYIPQGIVLGRPNTVVKLKGQLRVGAPGYIRGITKTQLVDGIERRLFEGYASQPPPTNSTDSWNEGDRLWNVSPVPGGWVGWVCTASGTPGTWMGFGRIEAPSP